MARYLDKKLCGLVIINNTKSVTVAWKIVGTPIDEGDLSLRPLKLINKIALFFISLLILIHL